MNEGANPATPEPGAGGGSPSTSPAKVGCMVVGGGCGLLLVIMIGLGIYVAMNWESIVGGFYRTAARTVIEASDLPTEQKDQIFVIIDRVIEDFQSGEIDQVVLNRIADNVAPVVQAVLGVSAVERYINPSGLSDEEKSAGRMAVWRVVEAMFKGTVSDADMDRLRAIVDKTPDSEETNLKESLTDEEVRELIAVAREAADKAEIPEEVAEPDVADEIEKAVQKAYEAR
ncbi:MAG: hypothetical protein AAF488_01005 [Planctomycetota bacterium]